METEVNGLMKKLSLLANASLMMCVIGLLFVFKHFNVNYMVYHSIPTLVLYIIFFIMILKNKLQLFFWSVYMTIAIYMGAATICLGTGYGFNLYCMSLIPIAFYSEYLAKKSGNDKAWLGLSSMGLVAIYFISTEMALYRGPLYDAGEKAAHVFFTLNSVFVFGFLIGYTAIMVKVIKNSQDKLEYMAQRDNLTGLWNRHFLMSKLREMGKNNEISWIALLDIDKFKRVNDTYGHASGDKVLIEVANSMKFVCKDCFVARWGGEEFLIVPKKPGVSKDILEKLREHIEKTSIKYEDLTIKVTVSIGAFDFDKELEVEKTIQKADENLYLSKNNGRNQVTW